MSMTQVIRKNNKGDFKITPLKIQSKFRFIQKIPSEEDHSPIESPCFKKEYSMASTIDSPLSISSMADEKEINEVPELNLEEICHSYHSNGYCMHGTECTLLHCNENEENSEDEIRGVKSSIILNNFPELLMLSPLRKNKSFLY